jgi:hypothetical protein
VDKFVFFLLLFRTAKTQPLEWIGDVICIVTRNVTGLLWS